MVLAFIFGGGKDGLLGFHKKVPSPLSYSLLLQRFQPDYKRPVKNGLFPLCQVKYIYRF